jgi:hypothetical protein
MPTRVKGVIELRKALRKFEPDLAKETNKELATALKPIVAKARGFLPSNDAVPSGWLKRENAGGHWASKYYDQSEAKRGITYKTSPTKANRKGWRSIASILNKSAGGSIYETAGRKTAGQQGASVNRNAGQEFIAELNRTGELKNADNQKRVGRHSNKFKGRAMFRAVAEDEGKTTAAVMRALGKAEEKFKGATK